VRRLICAITAAAERAATVKRGYLKTLPPVRHTSRDWRAGRGRHQTLPRARAPTSREGGCSDRPGHRQAGVDQVEGVQAPLHRRRADVEARGAGFNFRRSAHLDFVLRHQQLSGEHVCLALERAVDVACEVTCRQ
jgi:hypothetical protein